jgi:hypothetical protein
MDGGAQSTSLRVLFVNRAGIIFFLTCVTHQLFHRVVSVPCLTGETLVYASLVPENVK